MTDHPLAAPEVFLSLFLLLRLREFVHRFQCIFV